mmetsp:Transcript_76356/g.134828  ORF Transcript_76356/g.134828 Transcript_76356/m.134828 type:complete len:237 (-) Transcript_76356:194-904(-)
MISFCVFITNGPCCATGSPMGLPCSTRTSTGSELEGFCSNTSRSPWRTMTHCSLRTLVPMDTSGPSMKYAARLVPAGAAGTVNTAPGASSSSQTPTWLFLSAAQDRGGGARPWAPSKDPAYTVTLVLPSGLTGFGICPAQCITKQGSVILSFPGRLSQIWNNRSGFGLSMWTRGNISPWTIPLPAVIHCRSPSPYLPAFPIESVWSMTPSVVAVKVSKPRCGCCGNPGMRSPWYMR